MANKGAVADFIVSWERLTANVDRNTAELPAHIQLYSAPMVELLNALREMGASKQDRKSVKQQETKDSQELQKKGRKLAAKLRAALIAHHGPDSELLGAYGIPPRRPRKRKKGQPGTPQPGNPGSAPPEVKPGSQAGGQSKPAAQGTEGKTAPQAAEQPKPEDPAPAPQSKPAPQTS